MSWVVELLDSRVRDELDALPDDMKARFRRIVELIQAYGLEQMRAPHVNPDFSQGSSQASIEMSLDAAA